MTLEEMILANLLIGWEPEPVDQVTYWLWLAGQVLCESEHEAGWCST